MARAPDPVPPSPTVKVVRASKWRAWWLLAWVLAGAAAPPRLAAAQAPAAQTPAGEPPAHYLQPPPAPPPPAPHWDWPAPAAAAPTVHRGFYTHVQLHMGLLSRAAATEGVVDTGGASLALGHSVFTDRLVAFLQLGACGDQSPRRAGAFFSELGLGYYLPSPNLMLALLIGSASFAYTDAEGARVRDAGASSGLGLAYEWLLDGGPGAVGIAAELRSATIDQRRLYAANLGLSFTYH